MSLPTAPLPTPRQTVTNLINTLSSSLTSQDDADASTANPLLHPSPNAKNLLLTLHVLFPTEFLPALDLLDRNLITCLVLKPHYNSSEAKERSMAEVSGNLYFCKSAQQQPSSRQSYSRFKDALATQWYEVRTGAWNCSCPAFAFSAFPAVTAEDEGDDRNENGVRDETGEEHQEGQCEDMTRAREGEWMFGGRSFGRAVPVCKHLLACILIERIEAFKGRITVSEVSREEMAGWCAGWEG